ncbi:MAG TPA: EF-hand domain-containing protein [Alphaproteobacteria bacterium]|nr:EF-hand domain-containing protein [Alphaproteobacteria bacterium]MDP7163843.1 EF-hand domain-containing protein [Alphaproteobacteria bacterium]MDP7428474.1 EF-hand domain-containing protein [Alphaproteobacteria bacterium]HJM52105.1 EF-hand domain-containing protein [Alphaproteobacteria bacterium]
MRILALSFFGILLLVPGAPARGADPGAEFERISAACQADKAGCEGALWTFVDINADGRLTVAEITRFFRFAIGGQHRPPAESSAADRLLASVIGGPLGARVFIKNFDYDGDGQVARKEFYRDAGEAGMEPLLVRLRQAFEQTAGQAAALAGAVAGGAMKGPPAPHPAPAPAPAARDQSEPPYLAFLRLAGQCWQPISSAGQANTPLIIYRVKLKTNGFLARDPRRRSSHSRKEQASHLYKVIRSRGLAAIADCQPYELPLADYDGWKEMDVAFSPQGLRQVAKIRIKAKQGKAPTIKAQQIKNFRSKDGLRLRYRKGKMSPPVKRSFHTRFSRCWDNQPRGTGDSTPLLQYRLQLDENGYLEMADMQANKRKKAVGWEIVHDAAIKAFAKCQPYKLPKKLYHEWQVIGVQLWPKGFATF